MGVRMGKFAQFLGFETVTETDSGSGVVESLSYQVETLREALSRSDMFQEDRGWQKLTEQGSAAFTRDGLRQISDINRVMFVMNPLIKRGGNIRAAYVWGQGVEIAARDDTVNGVVQGFLDDEGNREAYTGHQARVQHENALFTDGNFFVACFTNPLTGRVQVRDIPFDQVTEILTDPGDKTRPWFYLRQWTEQTITPDGRRDTAQRKAYYPALKYQPATRFKRINDVDVYWDSPVKHVKVNALSGQQFGVGDAYAAVPWARAHKEFLEDWALLCKALSRIAYQTSAKKTADSQKKRAALESMGNAPAGSTVSMSEGQTLEAVPKTGATLDSGSSHPLMVMVAMALGVPVTVLSGDPGSTGARAVAETLDMPTRLEMQGRQEVHAEAHRDITGYVVEQAIIAPRGPLRGTTVRDGDRLYAKLAGDTDSTLEVVWPDLEEQPLDVFMKALVEADGMGAIPPVEKIKLALRALKVKDVDDILDQLTDDDGNLTDPTFGMGQQAADAYNRGEDPATVA